MFKNCAYLKDRPSLLALVALHVPLEFGCSQQVDQVGEGKGNRALWALDVLISLHEDLGVEEMYLQAYLPLIPLDTAPSADCKEAFLATLRLSYSESVDILMRIQLSLLSYNRYDGRGRSLFRNLARCFDIKTHDYILIEKQLGMYMHEHESEFNMILHRKKSRTSREKLIRYAKIGAVSLGAGAILAVTGGLAAPAVAGALILMGGTTATAAAAAVSVTTMATLFGGTGLGLTGYKMLKRTRGVEEFEFELHSQPKGQLALMVMISGWMEQEDDYKRAFGVLPEQLSFRERLMRFYTAHCPERLDKAAEELEDYEETPSALYDTLLELTGLDPRDDSNLLPVPLDLRDVTPEAVRAVMEIISEIDSAAHPKSMFSSQKSAPAPPKSSAKAENAKKPAAQPVTSGAASAGAQSPSSSSPASPRPPLPPSSTSSRSSSPGRQASGRQATAAKAPGEFEYENFSSLVAQSTQAGMRIPGVKHSEQVFPQHDSERNDDDDEEDDGQGGSPDPEDTGIEEVELDAATKERLLPSTYWHWKELQESQVYELYLLRWETKLQRQLGDSIVQMIANLSSSAVQHILATTVFASLAAAVMWPVMLIKITDVIDNLWTIAIERADAAGVELARALLSRVHGSRPVTLVGYSLGARVIFSCLKELALIAECKQQQELQQLGASNPSHERSSEAPSQTPPEQANPHPSSSEKKGIVQGAVGAVGGAIAGAGRGVGRGLQKGVGWLSGNRSSTNSPLPENVSDNANSAESAAAGDADSSKDDEDIHLSSMEIKSLVQDAILLGTPVSATSKYWANIRTVVGGRLVNGYSSTDLILSLIYRYQRFNFTVAGISAVDQPGMENVNLSELIHTHTDYGRRMKDVLQLLELHRPCKEA